MRPNIDSHFSRIEHLKLEIDRVVPIDARGVIEFRADLAGLFVVAIVASYESCVKDCMVGYATSKHAGFGDFAVRQYERLNSRIRLGDLHRYSKLFSDEVSGRFKNSVNRRTKKFDSYTGQNLEKQYDQLLRWRHEFAHAGLRNTTIEEAYKTHRYARQLLYAFDDAFCTDT